MEQNLSLPVEIKMVANEPTPGELFVCSAKIKPEAGEPLKIAFEADKNIPEYLEHLYHNHLAYAYEHIEKYFQAGPSVDFKEIVYVFKTENIDEAKQLMHNDPFYKEGFYYDDSWFPWEIHSPRWKTPEHWKETHNNFLANVGIIPKYLQGIKQPVEEVRIDEITPYKLFASFCKMNEKIMQPWMAPESTTSLASFIQHVYYCNGPGGVGTMGYHWLAGPSTDFSQDLTILSVNSLFMAQLVRENDPLVKINAFYDISYFEWCIHLPVRKASPQHKDKLKKFLQDAGISLPKREL